MRVAVIGAGPAGLVTLKYLKQVHEYLKTEPMEVRCFEAADEVGGTFRYRTYEQAELVSSRQLTSFSDFRVHDKHPDFLSTAEYCGYLKEYCTEFNLWESITLHTRVIRIQKRPNSRKHSVTFVHQSSRDTELHWDCDAIAVCTGLHVQPNIIDLPGVERIPEVLHSSQFKHSKQFGVDKHVMILGAGETAVSSHHVAWALGGSSPRSPLFPPLE
jgi:dimethylaniline monooxygenase (N-oxide forming)